MKNPWRSTRPPGARDADRRGVHLPEDLDGALQRYIDSLKPAPGKSAIVRAALEAFLEERGFWPPAADN